MRIVATAAGTGLILGGAMLAVGLRHNAQGEFRDTATGRLDLGYCLLVFGSWFLLGALGGAALAAAWSGIARIARRAGGSGGE